MGACCSKRKYDAEDKFLIYRQRHAVNKNNDHTYLDGQEEKIINYEEYQHRFCNRNSTTTYLSLIQEEVIDPKDCSIQNVDDKVEMTNESSKVHERLNSSGEFYPEKAILPKRLKPKYSSKMKESNSKNKLRCSSHSNFSDDEGQISSQVKRKCSNPYMKVIHDDTNYDGKPKVEYVRTSNTSLMRGGHTGSNY